MNYERYSHSAFILHRSNYCLLQNRQPHFFSVQFCFYPVGKCGLMRHMAKGFRWDIDHRPGEPERPEVLMVTGELNPSLNLQKSTSTSGKKDLI